MARSVGLTILLMAGSLQASGAPAAIPRPVSPAGLVELSCPTFSWSSVAGVAGYELVVYVVTEDGKVGEAPLMSASLPGGASSWTPSGARCLPTGESFAWSLRILGEEGPEGWSAPALFEVAATPNVAEVEAALATLRRYLAESRETDSQRPDREAARSASARTSPSLGSIPSAMATQAAPTLGTASLTLSDQVHLGTDSDVFKDGEVFLWRDDSGNTGLGRSALASASEAASHNTASGSRALASNTTGHRNAAMGARALESNTSGAWNTAIGTFALRANVTGSKNTVIGYRALRNGTGDGNVAIGYNAGLQATDGDDNIYISNFGSEESGTIRIGSVSQDTTYIAGIHGSFVSTALDDMPVLVDTSGRLGTQQSSRRFKEAIADLGDTSERLLELRPVRFRYKEQEGEGPEQYGLLAEEVAEVFPELVVEGEDGDPYSVRYHVLAPLLLNELLRADRERRRVERDLAGQRAELDALRERLTALAPTETEMRIGPEPGIAEDSCRPR